MRIGRVQIESPHRADTLLPVDVLVMALAFTVHNESPKHVAAARAMYAVRPPGIRACVPLLAGVRELQERITSTFALNASKVIGSDAYQRSSRIMLSTRLTPNESALSLTVRLMPDVLRPNTEVLQTWTCDNARVWHPGDVELSADGVMEFHAPLAQPLDTLRNTPHDTPADHKSVIAFDTTVRDIMLSTRYLIRPMLKALGVA